MKTTSDSITERAVFQRLKRHLEKHDDVLLKKSREGKWQQELGEYYTVDIKNNAIVKKHINLEELAREKFVLAKHERLFPPVGTPLK